MAILFLKHVRPNFYLFQLFFSLVIPETMPLPFPLVILHSWLLCSIRYSLRARRHLREDFLCHTRFFERLCFPLFSHAASGSQGKQVTVASLRCLLYLYSWLPFCSQLQEKGNRVHLENTQALFTEFLYTVMRIEPVPGWKTILLNFTLFIRHPYNAASKISTVIIQYSLNNSNIKISYNIKNIKD